MKIKIACLAGMFLLSADVTLQAAEPDSPNFVLTPARKLIGTWKTPLYVPYRIQTDFVTGILEDVATEKRLVTWIITQGPTKSTVNIQQVFKTRKFTVLRPELGSTGYTPDISPNFYIGKINGTRLTVKDGSGNKCGTFTFTTHHMQGNWHDDWEIVYRQNVYTVKKDLKFMKK